MKIAAIYTFVLSVIMLAIVFTVSSPLQPSRDFFVLTIPKSGTHLFMRILKGVTFKNPTGAYPHGRGFPELGGFLFAEDQPQSLAGPGKLEAYASEQKTRNKFLVAHFNFSKPFSDFAAQHREYVKIIGMRDLRDCLVSCVFYKQKEIQEETGLTEFDDQLMYLIREDKNSPSPEIFNLHRQAKNALGWIEDPRVVVLRFENLVGPLGGGDAEIQRETILMLANRLNVPLNQNNFNRVLSSIFGKNGKFDETFREGKVGSWKQYFKPEHLKAFEEEGWTDLQKGLGY